MRREASSDRQNANPASALVNHDQGARREVGLVLVESGEPLRWVLGLVARRTPHRIRRVRRVCLSPWRG